MPISTTCPGCGKVISGPDSVAGHKARCPMCKGVVEFPRAAEANPAAALAAKAQPESAGAAMAQAVAEEESGSRAAAHAESSPTPTPSRGGSRSSRSASTTIDRMLARTSPYDSLRLMAAIIFGVGIAVSALVLLGGLGGLIVLSTAGSPWAGVGTFVGSLVLAMVLLLGARTVNELLRLWADVGDRARHMTQMFEDSLNRQHEQRENGSV